ncbi:MAG: tRNA (adenosine(37)-N6)-threonylcarbamoyltransferase complex dimerization subunit type 1 TsaB [Gemmatimonadota bacterium]
MSLLVAIETSTELGSVAIGSGDVQAPDGGLIGEVTLGVPARHAEALLPALDFLLRTARLDRSRIAGIVVGGGPGSFTGVRIAAATARGLARGLDVPLYACSSLAALALAVERPGAVCALFDARRGEVYAACYEREAGTDALRTTLDPVALTVAALLARLPRPLPAFVGAGARRYAVELGLAPAAVAPLHPRASALLRLAHGDALAGTAGEGAAWEPAYVRPSGAERGIAG